MLKQPSGQVKLTNIALMKYKVGNKKFEIACYRNKAIDYRKGIETDLDEVLQSVVIYSNAQQGHQASKEELEKYFPGMKFKDIMKMILEKGEIQITDKEREHQIDVMSKDIANIIAEKCCHPDSKRAFALESIKAAMKKIHFPVRLDQNAKKQASDCTKILQEKFVLARAEMKVQLNIAKDKKESLVKELQEIQVVVKEEFTEGEKSHLICLIEPSKYRSIEDILKNKLQDGSMEILNQYVTNKEVTDIEKAGTVNLQLREGVKLEEYKEEEDSDDASAIATKSNRKGTTSKKGKGKHKEEVKEEIKKEIPTEDTKNLVIKEENADVKIAVENVKEKVSEEKKFKCGSCTDAVFNSNQEFRSHFKTEWHNFNLKRKMEKKTLPVTEEEFRSLQFDKEFDKKISK